MLMKLLIYLRESPQYFKLTISFKMVEPVFISPFFVSYILPFVLVFTIVFAVLQRTKLLGDNVKQINAIVGLVVGLILISFPFARNIVNQLMPFLAVVLVIFLVFILSYGFFSKKNNSQDDFLSSKLKLVFTILLGLGLIIFLLIITGVWHKIPGLISFNFSENFWLNLLLFLVIVISIVAVLKKQKNEPNNS